MRWFNKLADAADRRRELIRVARTERFASDVEDCLKCGKEFKVIEGTSGLYCKRHEPTRKRPKPKEVDKETEYS